MYTSASPTIDLSELIPRALQTFWGLEISINDGEVSSSPTLRSIVSEILAVFDNDDLIFAAVSRTTVAKIVLLLHAFEALAPMPSTSPSNHPDLAEARAEAASLIRWVTSSRPQLLDEMRGLGWPIPVRMTPCTQRA